MVVETRIAHPQQMCVVYVSYNIVPRSTSRAIEELLPQWYHKEYITQEDWG